MKRYMRGVGVGGNYGCVGHLLTETPRHSFNTSIRLNKKHCLLLQLCFSFISHCYVGSALIVLPQDAFLLL